MTKLYLLCQIDPVNSPVSEIVLTKKVNGVVYAQMNTSLALSHAREAGKMVHHMKKEVM